MAGSADNSEDSSIVWRELSRRAALVSHRLIGWIYWDPDAIANYAALGVPDGIGYYIATRGASLGAAGNSAVTAAFYSIHPTFVERSLDLCREHTTFEEAAAARDRAVASGLKRFSPEICEPLVSMESKLWDAAESLPVAGRVLFSSLIQWTRHTDPLVSSWLAVNAIREWRGDTHWAIQISEDLDESMTGILDGAWRGYEGDWLPRSRGADDSALEGAYIKLEQRGLAKDHKVTDKGLQYRQELEDHLDDLASAAWKSFGLEETIRFIDLLEPVGPRFVERIDQTAGPNWMPAARDNRPSDR
ncbi:MAG: Uncharacterised protein [Acidimicrobiales bacterium AG-410-I20]|nr:MAG: Uncharacterised protein [Acidimicrobiales bacterium AG-410-I20]